MIKHQQSLKGFVFRRPHEALMYKCVVQNQKHPVQQMIWGVISSKGMGSLRMVDGIMNGAKYADLVDSTIAPQMTAWFGRRTIYNFMHDLAPCHRTKVAADRLAKHKIPLLEWPANSPDLNPIENVWTFLKKKVKRLFRIENLN